MRVRAGGESLAVDGVSKWFSYREEDPHLQVLSPATSFASDRLWGRAATLIVSHQTAILAVPERVPLDAKEGTQSCTDNRSCFARP